MRVSIFEPIGQPKRALTETDEDGKTLVDPDTGAPVLKKRKVSENMPDLEKLYARLSDKCFPDKSKWSNQKFKDHAMNVFSAANKMIETDCFARGFIDRKDVRGLDIIKTVCEALSDQEKGITGWGYAR